MILLYSSKCSIFNIGIDILIWIRNYSFLFILLHFMYFHWISLNFISFRWFVLNSFRKSSMLILSIQTRIKLGISEKFEDIDKFERFANLENFRKR
jgi:hypothetical protein